MPDGHQKTVDPIWPTARGVDVAALPPYLSSMRAQISRRQRRC